LVTFSKARHTTNLVLGQTAKGPFVSENDNYIEQMGFDDYHQEPNVKKVTPAKQQPGLFIVVTLPNLL